MKLTERDRALLWHPFTQEKTADPVIAVKKAKGAYIYDEEDKPYLDLISSWWVNLHGHAHAGIAESIYAQAKQCEHVIFAGFTHKPAVELCEGLRDLLPLSLSRFFFSDNGSTAVEVALKMAYQYWYNLGQKKRTLFLSFEGGYHGDTFGAMAVGFKSGFHTAFSDILFKVLSIPYPATWEKDADVERKEQQALAILEAYLKEYSHHIAALIVEPLIQGASGMRVCRPHFIEAVLKRIEDQGILIIFDEVMTGFGRTGRYFALDYITMVPHFLCLSKGITGGFLPLGLTVTRQEIYEAFLNEAWSYAFAHGHSYTANPLACAAAITSLHILKSSTCQKSIEAIHKTHQEGMKHLKTYPFVCHPRILGTLSAFDIASKKYNQSQFQARLLEAGLLLRPLGKTIYLLPPFCITPDELMQAYQKIEDVVRTSLQ